MNKNLIFIIVGIGLVGYGLYVAFTGNNTMPTTNSDDMEVTESSGKKMAFADFVKQGGSYKCNVNQNIEGSTTVGTAYISGGMIRGEYSTQAQGININTSLIVRDGYTYTWSSMAAGMGFKSKVVDSNASDTNTGMSGQYSWNAQQIGDYDCEEWAPDMTQFELPGGITFREM